VGSDERMERLIADDELDQWAELERRGELPPPRDDPDDEPTEPWARTVDRGEEPF